MSTEPAGVSERRDTDEPGTALMRAGLIVSDKGRVAPISREGAVTGLSALSDLDRDAMAFVYPLWPAPLTLPELSVVLNYPWHRLIKSPARLRQMGIWAMLVAPCRKKGSAGDPTERQFGRAVRVV